MSDVTTRINNMRSKELDSMNDVISRWIKYKMPKDASWLYNELSGTVNSAITSYGNGNQSLRVPAYKIVFDAMHTFDPDKGVDFKTHAYNNLKRLNRIQAKRTNIVSVPETVANDTRTITKAIASFYDEYGRDPNDDELSDITKLSKKRIDKILNGRHIISGSESVTEEGADRVHKSGISSDTLIDYLYSSSDNIDKKIIEMSAGRNGSKIYSNSQIASRLNITPAAVSQRMSKLRDKMTELRGLV